MDNLNFISWIKVKSNLERLQRTILIGGQNETTNAILFFLKKDSRDLDYVKETATLEKTLKQSFIDHPYLDSDSNRLPWLAKKLHDQKIIGHITLSQGERSDLAELAADLL